MSDTCKKLLTPVIGKVSRDKCLGVIPRSLVSQLLPLSCFFHQIFRTKALKSNSGMALLLAVTVMSLLVAVTVEFNKNMRQELVGSATVKENSQFGAIMRSGYNLAEAVLLQDAKDNASDSEHDRWAKLAESSFSGLFGRGNLELAVSDYAGKLQLNSLGFVAQESGEEGEEGEEGGEGGEAGEGGDSVADVGRAILTRLLASGDFGDLSEEEVSLIVDAITDWVDVDDEEKGIEDTESGYYLSRQPPYSSRNGPFEYIEELLLVRGITPELYFGTGEIKGLRDFVTVYGDDGKININSASVELLQAMGTDITEELAQKLIDFRADEDNKTVLEDNSWYKSVPSWPGDVEFSGDILTTKSDFFSITATATFAEMERTLFAVVKRESDDKIKMVSRKVK